MNDKVYIILINYKGYNDTLECLESLSKISYKNFQTIVVDNDSGNESLSHIKEWARGTGEKATGGNLRFSNEINKPYIFYKEEDINELNKIEIESTSNSRLILIQAKQNKGFAAGNNIALRFALKRNDFKYVWLLNNDTTVRENSLCELVKGINKCKKVAAVGSKIVYYENPSVLQNVGSKFDKKSFLKLCKPILDLKISNKDIGQYDKDYFVNDLMAASMLVKKEAIEQFGLMPEEYFLYGEETDWNFHFQRCGYQLLYIYRSVVLHKKSVSTGGDLSCLTLYYRTRNQILLNKKYMRRQKFIVFSVLLILKKLVISFRYNKQQRNVLYMALIHGLKGVNGKSINIGKIV